MTRKSGLLVVLPLFAGLCLGCGSSSTTPARLSGSVKLKKKSGEEVLVKAGTVKVFGKDGQQYGSGTIRPDGTYSVNDLPTGDMTLTVETESANPKRFQNVPKYGGPRGNAGKGGDGRAPGSFSPTPEGAQTAPDPANYVTIPMRYAAPSQSDVTVTLGRGSNSKDIELTE
jgi:hypothetical protein